MRPIGGAPTARSPRPVRSSETDADLVASDRWGQCPGPERPRLNGRAALCLQVTAMGDRCFAFAILGREVQKWSSIQPGTRPGPCAQAVESVARGRRNRVDLTQGLSVG